MTESQGQADVGNVLFALVREKVSCSPRSPAFVYWPRHVRRIMLMSRASCFSCFPWIVEVSWYGQASSSRPVLFTASEKLEIHTVVPFLRLGSLLLCAQLVHSWHHTPPPNLHVIDAQTREPVHAL